MAKVKISELPSLSPATLDTTFVVGISGSTTYKISINQLTSSLDTTFATDLVTAALSSSLDGKLSTSSYSTDSSSFDNRIKNSQPIGYLTTASYTTDSSSFNSRIISGSAVAGTISSSAQISGLGFITASTPTDLSSLNTISASYLSFTQSYYSASASFDSRVDSLENATSSYLTSLNGAISSSTQVLNGSGIFSSSAQLENATITNLTITNLTTINETSSVIYSSGSNQLGDALNDTQILSGSIKLVGTGSLNGYTILTSNDTASFLTTLNGAISSSAQVLNGSGIFSSSAQLPIGLVSGSSQILNSSGIFSSSAQLPTGLISSSTQLPSNLVSGSSQISTLGFITGSYISSSTYTTDSSSFNSRIISGSAVAGTISGSAQISELGYATTSSVTTISASAWGAFQSASSYSSSLATSISASNYNITINSASVSSISSSFVTSISASNASITALSSSNATTDNTQTTNITAASASAWGAFQTASANSSSLATSITSVSGTFTNLIVNGQPTTYGYANGAYLLAQNTTDQSVGLNVAVNFQTTSASNGSIITKTSNSQVTLTAGNTYKLEGIIRRLSSSSTWAAFRWYDVTNSAYVGIEGFSEVTNSPNAIGSTVVATAIVTPTVNTIYELRQTTVNTISVSGDYAGYEITQLNPAIAVQATATGTINNQYASITNGTDISITNGVAKDVTFDTVTASSGIPYNTSTGVFTLTSGVTYRFTGELSFAGYTGYALYTLVDATTNTPINGQIATCPSYDSGFSEANNNTYDAIYTPSTNQTVKFRITGSSFTGTGVIRGGYFGRINVQQINNAFALNTLDTMQISGSLTTTGSITSLGGITGSIRATNGVISGSSQLTSSFDTRYAISASFVSSSNVLSMRTITSASYAALTPVSGTLYIIIG